MRTLEVSRAAYKGVTECAGLKPGEAVLVLSDTAIEPALADAFAGAAYAAGGDTQTMVFETRPEINREPPRTVAAAMAAADLVIDLSASYFIHTDTYARVRDGGTRILCASGVTDDVLARLVAAVDYCQMAALGRRVTDAFTAGTTCTVETGDSDLLTMSLAGRECWLRDGMLEGRGDLDYLPGAQISIAPIEESMEGTITIDGPAFPPVALVGQPIRLEFRHGRLVGVTGGQAAAAWMAWLTAFGDPKMLYVAHISVGLNAAARLSGRILEDERIPGCFDIGMGSQMRHLGGTLGKAASHSDVVATSPRVMIDGKTLVDRGRFAI